jgi:hypothetical protein
MNGNLGTELKRASIAGVVAYVVALALKAVIGGKWIVAGVSGAIGGLVAVALTD